MFENMLSTENVNFVLVFLEGILSFLSPCVLPLIPIYISYLAGNGKKEIDGKITYERKTVLINTILFVFGISFAFFLLGMSFSAIGSFFKQYQDVFTKVAGIIIIFMGILQLGIFKIEFFQKEHKINSKISMKKMGPFMAFIMGFTFSFAWTPCVGPALASVLMLASSSTNMFYGNLLMLVYSLGFIIPFILLGLFTTQILNFIKNKQKLLQYTIKISAIILIIAGILTLTGAIENFNAFVNGIGDKTNQTENTQGTEEQIDDENEISENQIEDEEVQNSNKIMAMDFSLIDQYGKKHQMSDYRGKVVFLNFWATWCPPCQKEMPEIEELYKEYGSNKEEVIILGITNPKSKLYPYAQDKTQEEITQFIKKKNYTFPTVFDLKGEVFDFYYINSFPTTFMINKEGEVFGYVNGMMEKKEMKNIIEQTLVE